MARPRSPGHAKKTAQKKLSFLYGKSAPKRARYDLLQAGRNGFYLFRTPPVKNADGLAAAALFVQRLSKLTVPPPFFPTRDVKFSSNFGVLIVQIFSAPRNGLGPLPAQPFPFLRAAFPALSYHGPPPPVPLGIRFL